MKKTKIIATIGPSCEEQEVLKNMVLAGMNCARINMSHATFEECESRIEKIRSINEEGHNIGILIDTKGPEVRSGCFEGGKTTLTEGSIVTVTNNEIMGNDKELCIRYENLLSDLEVGNSVLLNNGLISLTVVEKLDDKLKCRVNNTGEIKDRRAVNLPDNELSIPFLSEKDTKDIEYACDKDVDFIALSFVSKKENVIGVKEILKNKGKENIKIISKIENNVALKNIDDILEVSDGIMVARGDLGVEVDFTKLPGIQKKLVRLANKKGKICIVATEMLASMETSLRPTRAEVSDVANAVLDCTDAVMLSGESATGLYPVNTVNVMAQICKDSESLIENNKTLVSVSDITDAIAYSTYESALRLNAKAIVASTISGYTASLISAFRPSCSIIAPTPYKKVATGLSLCYGVIPTIVKPYETNDELITDSIRLAKEVIETKKDDILVITGGHPTGVNTRTNFLKIEKL